MKPLRDFPGLGAGQGNRAAAARWGLICVFAWLVGCAGNPVPELSAGGSGASFGPGYPPGSAVWSKEARSAYRTAFMAGMQDQREGFRYDDDRGAAVLEVEERGFYRQGYRRGYYHEANVRRRERLEGEEAPHSAP